MSETQHQELILNEIKSNLSLACFLINGITQGTQREFVKLYLTKAIDVRKLSFIVFNENSNWLILLLRDDLDW